MLTFFFFAFPAITCGHPGNPIFGTTQGNQFNLNDNVRFVCSTGYVLHGAVKSTCQANGQWSNALPKCRSKCWQEMFNFDLFIFERRWSKVSSSFQPEALLSAGIFCFLLFMSSHKPRESTRRIENKVAEKEKKKNPVQIILLAFSITRPEIVLGDIYFRCYFHLAFLLLLPRGLHECQEHTLGK